MRLAMVTSEYIHWDGCPYWGRLVRESQWWELLMSYQDPKLVDFSLSWLGSGRKVWKKIDKTVFIKKIEKNSYKLVIYLRKDPSKCANFIVFGSTFGGCFDIVTFTITIVVWTYPGRKCWLINTNDNAHTKQIVWSSTRKHIDIHTRLNFYTSKS